MLSPYYNIISRGQSVTKHVVIVVGGGPTDEMSGQLAENELAKIIFAISEPRWLIKEDSKKISALRHRIHDLYFKYKSVGK
ncbi:MAG: hypothetical protein A2512_06500 [Deltaproteobacteria bacterium RIFOXYD12_FULL_56_24]|nr:MAG: hypothetical protein A2512_06500 [Deltaproteobacteria bacterium RIFOXYD12_FULL_56_24]